MSDVPEPWSVIAHNRRVTKGWLALCDKLRTNCTRCYDWLQFTPMKPINGRCYALRHNAPSTWYLIRYSEVHFQATRHRDRQLRVLV